MNELLLSLFLIVTVSKSLSQLSTKEQPLANCSRCYLKKSDISDLLVIQANCSQKRVICSKIPLIMPKSESLLLLSFKEQHERFTKSGGGDSLFFQNKSLFRLQKTEERIPNPAFSNQRLPPIPRVRPKTFNFVIRKYVCIVSTVYSKNAKAFVS